MVLFLLLQRYLLYTNNLVIDFGLELPVEQVSELDKILSYLYIEDAGRVPSLVPPALPLHWQQPSSTHFPGATLAFLSVRVG